MGTGVTYARQGSVATITMDDGKVNALSRAMFDELSRAVDRSEADGAAIVLTGRAEVFAAGFDLAELRALDRGSAELLRAGFELARRLLAHPLPVVVACNGHAVAMGAFLVLAADHRIGVAGDRHHLVTNEVAIGLVMPHAAIEICRQRLTPAAFEQAVVLAEPFPHDRAVAAGFLDAVVPASDLLATAQARAEQFMALDPAAHAATKLRARRPMLDALDAAIEADDADLRALVQP